MKTKTLLSVAALFIIISTFAQKTNLELTFSAIDGETCIQLDSIKVMNRTQGSDTILYWPDTLLVLDYQVGVPELFANQERLQVFQNYPNPVVKQTTISLYVPEKDKVGIIITNILGQEILKTERVLENGIHFFRFTPGSGGLFFFTAQCRRNSSSIKILQNNSNSKVENSLEYTGSELSSIQLKVTEAIQNFSFYTGDELLYIGYGNTLQSGMLDSPEISETYTFQFATNIPCPGTPTVTHEGQVYNTIQIFSQCWLKENLNIGSMISAADDMTDNGIVEKYCYNNILDNCITHGGLYQWNELMQYTTNQGAQGICPPGWHIPTDEEWKVMESAVDSQYEIGDPVWDGSNFHGYDAGWNLRTTSGWVEGGNGIDVFGFSALPGGYRDFGDIFYDGNYRAYWWTSTEFIDFIGWNHALYGWDPGVDRSVTNKVIGYSVRCVKDN